MSDISCCGDIIATFVQSCEEMSIYANQLYRSGDYGFVTTGTDVRNCQEGWHLERWIEASLNAEEGRELCWWLELSGHDNAMVVHSHISISHSDYFLNFPDKAATSLEELQNALKVAVAELTSAVTENQNLKLAIEKHKTH